MLLHVGVISAQTPQSTLNGVQINIFAAYPALESQAKEFGESYIKKDFERLVRLTLPAYVKSHGREQLLREFAATREKVMLLLAARGAEIASWSPSEATQLIEDGGLLYAVVPTTLKIKAAENIAETPICLIAVSADHGAQWSFISATCINVKRAFPAVADRLVLCS